MDSHRSSRSFRAEEEVVDFVPTDIVDLQDDSSSSDSSDSDIGETEGGFPRLSQKKKTPSPKSKSKKIEKKKKKSVSPVRKVPSPTVSSSSSDSSSDDEETIIRAALAAKKKAEAEATSAGLDAKEELLLEADDVPPTLKQKFRALLRFFFNRTNHNLKGPDKYRNGTRWMPQ